MTNQTLPVVFLAFARSEIERYAGLPRLADEARRLRQLFDAAEQDGHCRLLLRENATLDDVLDVFQDARYHGRIALFHFAGHGDEYSLLLENAARRPLLVDAGGFAAFLGEQRGLQLVFLNACSTLAHVEALHAAGVPAVIATREEIPDEWAPAFAVRFYTGLLGGAAVQPAFTMAREGVRSEDQDGKFDPALWGLYGRDRAALAWKLLRAPGAGQAAEERAPREKSIRIETPPPPPVFVGRQPELLELYRWLDEVRGGAPGDPGPHGRLGLVYGQAGLGKRELLRQWLADLRQHPQHPMLASTTFQVEDVSDLAQAEYYSSHPLWRLDWERYGQDLSRYFPEAFVIGRYPFLALAAQLAAQSERVRAALAAGERWDAGLHGDAPEALARRAVTEVVRLAAGEGRPVVLVLEQFHRAPDPWLTLVQAWEEEIRRARLPVLLLLTYDYPQPLTRPDPEDKPADTLAWLRRLCNPPLYYARSLFVPRLTPGEIELLLAPQSAEAAVELYSLSEGIPAIIEGLLAHWAATGAAEQGDDGRWRLARTFGFAVPGRLYDELVTQRLEESAARAQALGYTLEAGDLLAWLNHAAWEGEVFTDEALARAVGWYDGAYDPFEEVLDEALCGDLDDGDALVSQVDYLELPSGDGGTRFLTRYKFNPPLVGHVLRQRQDAAERLKAGRAQAEAVEAAYAPFHERVDGVLADLYQAIGLAGESATHRLRQQVWVDLDALERMLPLVEVLAHDAAGKRRLVRLIADYTFKAYGRRHGAILLEWLFKALPLSRQVGDKGGEAAALHNIGMVYSDLGEPQQALAYYEQALPLRGQVGDKGGKASTLHGIGTVYSDLGDKQQALAYSKQALSLFRQVGDKGGEAWTLHGIGVVYSDLGEPQQALVYYEQALPLSRQVGDKRGEAAALHSIGVVYSDLGDKQQALVYYEQALPLMRQVGYKRGEASTLRSIGMLLFNRNKLQQALEHHERALALFRQIGYKDGEAGTLRSISLVYIGLGQPQRALACCEQALALRRQTNDKAGEAWVLTDFGLIYAGLGEPRQALTYFKQALPLMQQTGERSGEAYTLRCMGVAHAGLGDLPQARALLDASLQLSRQVQEPWEQAQTLYELAKVARTAGDLTAEGHITLAVELDGQYDRPQLARDRALLAEMQEQRRAQEG